MSFHTFHIPVLGLGYSIDTPLKVARFGIHSVVSIVDDELCERMREYHCRSEHRHFEPIQKNAPDARARRITAYLDLLNNLLQEQLSRLREEPFEAGSAICKWFELLPDCSMRSLYCDMLAAADPVLRESLQARLRAAIGTGRIDVNIMAKVDKANYNSRGEYLGDEFTDALAALRGFANSSLRSALVISAGINKRLYSYLERFPDFFPGSNGKLRKTVILKVSDFRSATIQAKLLARKGIWVSEFRVESGLNCGGHAFATDGLLMGPILQEFKDKREALRAELFSLYSEALTGKGIAAIPAPEQRVSAQGGIGTAEEHRFLMAYYRLDATGWGSPFLLVPEATNVDADTRNKLAAAGKDDFYLSHSSPLGVPFNTFRKASMETLRQERINRGRPGSPCTKKYLCADTEFTEKPICTASKKYQQLKSEQIRTRNLPGEEEARQLDALREKVCLCEGLSASVYLENGQLKPKENRAVSICPGPNTAYFNSVYTLKEMVDHINGRVDLLTGVARPHIFLNELALYVQYFREHVLPHAHHGEKSAKQSQAFLAELQRGVDYYRELCLKGILQLDESLFDAELSGLLLDTEGMS
jgi:hypothetical protein